MLILQILATIFVWRRGWGPRALIPLPIAFIAGFVVALGGVESGLVFFLLDVLTVVALGVMYANAPSQPARPATIENLPTRYATDSQSKAA